MKLEKRGARQKVLLRKNTNTIFGIAAVLMTLVLLVPSTLTRALEEAAWPVRFRVLATLGSSSPVHELLALEGPPPQDAAGLAKAIEALAALGPRVIGVDLPLQDLQAPGGSLAPLAAAVEAAGNVVLASQVAGDEAEGSLRPVPPELARVATRQGYSVLLRNGEGVVTRSALYNLAGDASLFGWPVALVQEYLEVPDFARVIEGSELVLKVRGRDSALRIPLDSGGALRVNVGLLDRIPRAPLADLMAGRLSAELVRDRIVLLPGLAPGTEPQLPVVSAGTRDRTALQGGVVASILRDRMFVPCGSLVGGVLLLALALAVGLVAYLQPPWVQVLAGGFGLLVWWAGCVAALGIGGLVLPLAAPHLLVLGLLVAGALRHSFRPLVGVRLAEGGVATDAQAALSLGLKLMRDGREDEAIKYFQRVAGTDGELRDRGGTMLALVLLRKGDRTSVSQLVQSIDVSRIELDEAYELASHLEAAGEIDGAHTLFSQMANTDVSYKDVKSRLMGIRDRLSGFSEEDVADVIARKILDPRFRDVKLLGRGGMGFVFRCTDANADGRDVAVKVLSPFFANQEEVYKRFIREARCISDFSHPRIIEIYDVFDRNLPYYSMEFLSARSLKDLLTGGQRLPVEQVLQLSVQVCEGLAHANSHGVTHRDIKPDNIMLDANLEAKVIDFGIAHFDDGTQLTNTGATLGTPLYMSPEQVRGEPLDHRSDIFSYGVVLYEMLSGERPFQGMASRLLKAAPALDPALGLPERLVDAVAKSLEKEVEDRFQDFEEFQRELVAIQEAL